MSVNDTDLYAICLLEMDLVSRPYKPDKMSWILYFPSNIPPPPHLVFFVQYLV